jgi:hypothetical protein
VDRQHRTPADHVHDCRSWEWRRDGGFRVAPNRADGQRIGTTLRRRTSDPPWTQAGVAGAVCTFDLSPGGQAVSASGGTNLSFSVTAERLPVDGDEQRGVAHRGGKQQRQGQRHCPGSRRRERRGCPDGKHHRGGTTTFAVTQACRGRRRVHLQHSAPPVTSIAAAGGSGSITVSTGNGCAWTASRKRWVDHRDVGLRAQRQRVGRVHVAANAGSARTGRHPLWRPRCSR